MIDPKFIDLAAKHAGHETPDGLHEVCHRRACFSVCYDLGRISFLDHLGHTRAAPNQMVYYQLTAHRETLFSLITPFLNLAYLFTLAEMHKKPLADLHTVTIDKASGFPAADTLQKRIDGTVSKWRGIMAEIPDHAKAERLFYELRGRYQLPAGLAEAAADVCFWTFFFSEIMFVPEDYLSGFNTHAGKLAAQAIEAKKQWFEKLLESLTRRNLKSGKTADNSGFVGVIRDMERRGMKITRPSNGRNVFCADKIFKALNKYARENPYQFEDYDVFIEQTPDPKGFMDPVIFQITPDLKERRLTRVSFQQTYYQRLYPHKIIFVS